MINSHHVPQSILRKWGDKICVYNLKSKTLTEDIKPESVFASKGFYSEEIEDKLHLEIEAEFGSLLANKILKAKGTVELYKKQLMTVKKFLLIAVLRSLGGEEFMQIEKNYYTISNTQPPFEEQVIEGETSFDYWMRTLKVVLATDGTPQEILKIPEKTYPAYRWAMIIYVARVGFWDAPDKGDEFLITDAGMTSENELGWDGVFIQNRKKLSWLCSLLKQINDEKEKEKVFNLCQATAYFHENFQMFPISAKRMIVLISPFYNMRHLMKSQGYAVPSLTELTGLPNEELFKANPRVDGTTTEGSYKNNKYIYDICKLTRKEIRYCNCLFLDRIDTNLGFSELRNVAGSVVTYYNAPCVPRVDYTELYNVIQNRFPGKFERVNKS